LGSHTRFGFHRVGTDGVDGRTWRHAPQLGDDQLTMPCGVGCAEVRWNYLWVANGVKALDAYDASHPGANVYYGFSASSNIMIKSLMGKPNDMSDHYYLLGTPQSSAERGFSLPTGDYSNVDFVAVQGDSVVFGNGNGNTFARHLSGYDKLDLALPTSVTIDPRTRARTLYFAAPAAPSRRLASATSQASAVEPAGEDLDTTSAVSRREARADQLAERRAAREQLRQERKQELAAQVADRKAERHARHAERAERSAA